MTHIYFMQCRSTTHQPYSNSLYPYIWNYLTLRPHGCGSCRKKDCALAFGKFHQPFEAMSYTFERLVCLCQVWRICEFYRMQNCRRLQSMVLRSRGSCHCCGQYQHAQCKVLSKWCRGGASRLCTEEILHRLLILEEPCFEHLMRYWNKKKDLPWGRWSCSFGSCLYFYVTFLITLFWGLI